MIELGADAKAIPPERQRHADGVIGVDQVIRRRTQIELGEDRADDVELHPFTGIGPADADDAETVAESNRRDSRRVFSARVGDGLKFTAQQTRERARLLWSG